MERGDALIYKEITCDGLLAMVAGLKEMDIELSHDDIFMDYG